MQVPHKVFILFTVLLMLASCAEEKAPATPIQTFKTYTKAISQKDTATMKLLLSKETLKMHELEAQAQGVDVDEIVRRETIFGENQRSVRLRNEKINGDMATLEVENARGDWETVPFSKEDGEWKIDKKGFAQRLMEESQKSNKEMEEMMNQGRQP